MRARQQDGPQKTLHVVPTYPDAAGLVAGPRRVDSESNELTAIPRLLETLASGGEKCAAPVVWFWWRRPTPQRQGVFCFPRVPSAGTKDDESESGRTIFEPD
jgi:hypothetical protein